MGSTDVKPTMETLQENLRQFTGTETWHRSIIPGFTFTDGILAMAEEAGAFWLIDIAASAQLDRTVRQTPFQVWRIEVEHDPDRGHNKGIIYSTPWP